MARGLGAVLCGLLLTGCAAGDKVGELAERYAGYYVSMADSEYDMAEALLADGNGQLMFHHPGFDNDAMYQTIESLSPYQLTLKSELYAQDILRLTLIHPQQEQQDKGLAKARRLGSKAAKQEKTIEDKLEAIHDVLVRRCVYEEAGEKAPEAVKNATQTAMGAVIRRRAVCAGYARAFMAMCDGAGIDVIYVASPDMNHSWNALRLYGKTYFIDCTYDDPVPDRGHAVLHDYFLRTAEEMKETHQWDEDFYEQLLDTCYPADFAYIQRMQDLQLAPKSLRAADTDTPASQNQVQSLEAEMGVSLSLEENPTCGELYRAGYEQRELAAERE